MDQYEQARVDLYIGRANGNVPAAYKQFCYDENRGMATNLLASGVFGGLLAGAVQTRGDIDSVTVLSLVSTCLLWFLLGVLITACLSVPHILKYKKSTEIFAQRLREQAKQHI